MGFKPKLPQEIPQFNSLSLTYLQTARADLLLQVIKAVALTKDRL
jgi:hypothetical protein